MEEQHLHVHIHFADIQQLLSAVTKAEKRIMATLADIQAQNDALAAAVAAEDTVIDSAVVLINGFGSILTDIKAQLAAAIASNDPVAMQSVVDAMGNTITDVNAKKDALAAAVQAGTTPAPAPQSSKK